MQIHDMLIHGEPPAKFVKALAVIAEHLHPTFDRQPWIARPDKSKESCVLASLAVRDFLWRVGFKDAVARPVVFFINATAANGEMIHSLGCGNPDMEVVRRERATDEGWTGHMIVTVPSVGYLVDATLYQAIRPQWENLPGMIAAKLVPGDRASQLWGLDPVAGTSATKSDGSTLDIVWLDQPENRVWRDAGDAARNRRFEVVTELTHHFRNRRQTP